MTSFVLDIKAVGKSFPGVRALAIRITRFVGAENLSLIIALLLVMVISMQSEFLFSSRNLFNIAQNMAVMGRNAVGMTLVIRSAGLDISVGSNTGCASVVCALIVTGAGTVTGGLAVGVVIGLVLGLVHALIINYLRVNAVVATLVTLSAFRGMAFLIAPKGCPVGVLDPTFAMLGSGRFLQVGDFPGIPIAFAILLGVALVAHLGMSAAVFGRSVYSMGGNPAAVLSNGMNLLGIATFYQLLAKGMLLLPAEATWRWCMASAEKRQAKLTATGGA